MASDAFSRIEEDLREHSNWIRRLARSLVASEDDAEELVQDTWVAALRRPPDPGSPARPWLARVVRNLAARRWRQRAASLDAPDALSAAGAEDLLDSSERLETQRILVEELQALSEPARRVIVWRYFDGLDGAEIARRSGEAPGTVRWRLHEALSELRTRLDRRHGGTRETWARALTFAAPALALPPLEPRPAPPSAAPLPSPIPSAPLVPATLAASTGILAVNTFVKIAAAIAVVLALSVGVYVTTQGPAAAPSLETPAAVQAAPLATPPAREPLKTELAAGASAEEREVIEAPRPAAKPSAPAAAAERSILVARCIDKNLRPLPGAWLTPRLALVRGGPDPSAPVARSGGTGELELDIESGSADSITNGGTGFVAGCDGYATRWLRVKLTPGRTAYAGDIVFEPAGSVAGRVTDEHGAPIAGAEIAVTSPGENRPAGDLELMRARGPEFDIGAPGAKSRDDGRFKVAGVPVGLARVWARAKGMRWSVSVPLEIGAHHETDAGELVLEPEDAGANTFGPIEGIVLAPDETPVKTPNITVLYSEGNSSSSIASQGRADGHFKIVPMGRGPHELTFSDPESRFTPVRLEGVAPGTRALVVRLGQPKPIAVVVRSQREPVTQFKLTWREAGGRDDHAGTPSQKHPDGRAILMAPSSKFTFKVDADGYLPVTLGPYDGERAPAEIEVALEALPGVHGRVLAAGEPVPGARVWLQTYGRHMLVQVNEFDLWVDPNEQYVTTSDSEGRFRLGLQKDGEFMLFAEASGFAKCELGPIELSASAGQKGLELALDQGGTIEGRVLVAPGRNAAGTIVGANHGEGQPRTQTVGPDGRFRFERLTPGTWKVMRCHSDFSGGTSTSISSGDGIVGGKIDTNCSVTSGGTTTFDLDLRDNAVCILELDLKLDGQPAQAWSVTLEPAGAFAIARELPHGATDLQGRARIEVEDAGSYEVVFAPPAESSASLEIKFAVDVARGSNPLVRDLRTGRVEGSIASWRPDSEHGWLYQSGKDADFVARTPIRADASGHFVLPIVPIGPGMILHDIATEARSTEYVSAAEFSVSAGETRTVQVP